MAQYLFYVGIQAIYLNWNMPPHNYVRIEKTSSWYKKHPCWRTNPRRKLRYMYPFNQWMNKNEHSACTVGSGHNLMLLISKTMKYSKILSCMMSAVGIKCTTSASTCTNAAWSQYNYLQKELLVKNQESVKPHTQLSS